MSCNKTCNNCRFFDRNDADELSEGLCRKSAPQVSFRNPEAAYWPTVVGDDWCGEHAEKGGE